jgi:hypothetical protein
MEAITDELALRYLLELSTDIRVAFLTDAQGELMAAAPDSPGEHVTAVGADLVREAAALADGGDASVEVDVTLERGSVFCVREHGRALVCVTGRFALPGLILHDMRIALDDLRRGRAEKPE